MTVPASVTIVHERFTELGGSEKVVEAIAGLFPSPSIASPIIDPAILGPGLAPLPNRTSFVDGLYRGGGSYSHLLALLPSAMRSLPIGADTELVVLSHHAFSHRVRIPQGVPSISYVHSPARWMWDPTFRIGEAPNPAADRALAMFAATQRPFDRAAAQRPDVLVANSSEVADRIMRWWGRSSVVIPPPVAQDLDPARTAATKREDFFLLAGRLVPYKRADIAVEAATRVGANLVVVGEGRHRRLCESLAGPSVTFLGAVDDTQLQDLYRRCRALVFPGVEDFGIVPVEAMAHGAPVVGVARGGLLDTVVPGVTGTLVEDDPDRDTLVDSFANVLSDPHSPFEHEKIVRHAATFSAEAFAEQFNAEVYRLLSDRREPVKSVDHSRSARWRRR